MKLFIKYILFFIFTACSICANANQMRFVGYYESWFDQVTPTTPVTTLGLANVPTYVTDVMVAFASPATTYNPNQPYNISGSEIGLSADNVSNPNSYAYNGIKLYAAMQALKAKNPNVRIWLSVGGAQLAGGWDAFLANPNKYAPQIVALAKQYGFFGIDIDYEQYIAGNCTWATGGDSCQTDNRIFTVVTAFKQAVNQIDPDLQLSMPVWSVGAFGDPQATGGISYPNPQHPMPCTDPNLGCSAENNLTTAPNFGMMLNPFLKYHLDRDLYMINLMSYDAGDGNTVKTPAGNIVPADVHYTAYFYQDAYQAYKYLLSGNGSKINIGIEVPPESWGGNVSTAVDAYNLALYAAQNGAGGAMIWSINPVRFLTNGDPTSSIIYNQANAYSQNLCLGLQLNHCQQQMPAPNIMGAP